MRPTIGGVLFRNLAAKPRAASPASIGSANRRVYTWKGLSSTKAPEPIWREKTVKYRYPVA